MRLNFKRIGLLCGRAARACAGKMGLTVARLDLLALLLLHELAQVEIAAILCVSEPVVSVLVRTLEGQGWVQRRRHEKDKRLRLCSLTTTGRRELERHLNDQVNVDPDGQYGAQCMGEQFWIGVDWQGPLENTGLEFGAMLAHHQTELSVFRAIQTWNKRCDYQKFLDGGHGYGRAFWASTYVTNDGYRPRRTYAHAELPVLRLNQFGEPLPARRRPSVRRATAKAASGSQLASAPAAASQPAD